MAEAARLSEDDLISHFFAPLAGMGGLGLKDDAALLIERPGHDLVVTVDAVVEGVHFLPDDPPDTLGWKALGVNVSDLVAKGAEPVGFLLALALPQNWKSNWLERFAAGLAAAAEAWQCPLLGGDTVRASGGPTLSVTAFGHVPVGRMVRRTTARPGEVICVTGTIGDAVLGLRLLVGQATCRDALGPTDIAELVDAYRIPRPRIAFAAILREYAGAAMDVSDGLAGDTAKLLRVSGVSGAIDLDCVPMSGAACAALRIEPRLRDGLVTGGDDYEILFTVAPERLDALISQANRAGVPVTAIGHVEAGDAPLAIRENGRAYSLSAASFRHF